MARASGVRGGGVKRDEGLWVSDDAEADPDDFEEDELDGDDDFDDEDDNNGDDSCRRISGVVNMRHQHDNDFLVYDVCSNMRQQQTTTTTTTSMLPSFTLIWSTTIPNPISWRGTRKNMMVATAGIGNTG